MPDEPIPNEPTPEQTDNRERPEDGPQDVSQDPAVAYDEAGNELREPTQ